MCRSKWANLAPWDLRAQTLSPQGLGWGRDSECFHCWRWGRGEETPFSSVGSLDKTPRLLSVWTRQFARRVRWAVVFTAQKCPRACVGGPLAGVNRDFRLSAGGEVGGSVNLPRALPQAGRKGPLAGVSGTLTRACGALPQPCPAASLFRCGAFCGGDGVRAWGRRAAPQPGSRTLARS